MWRPGVPRGGIDGSSAISKELVSRFAGEFERHSRIETGALAMSKMNGDSARFNKIKSRRNVHRARMRALRAEIAARKILAGSDLERLKT